MLEFIFTLDYEIYGNGEGSLRELVYEPAERLAVIFRKHQTRFVVFAEVAELEMIEKMGTDSDIDLVKNQIRNLYKEGFELGLHIHPGWYNAHYQKGNWQIDYSEYNLCVLPKKRIAQIIDRSISYLRGILSVADFTPISYRAGHLLFQPTLTVASVLAERGIEVDSSVYKGGLWHRHKLDYRRALSNGYYWWFTDDTNVPDPLGTLLELPIYTRMVPTWRMLTSKRIGLEQKGASAAQTGKKILYRFIDFLRFCHPLKFDFCSMTLNELTSVVDTVIKEDEQDPTSFRPIVAIGHTKELVDFETVESFLAYLDQKKIRISTFEEVYGKCVTAAAS
jgi:hypothetical protein